jgi:hypothetical protein
MLYPLSYGRTAATSAASHTLACGPAAGEIDRQAKRSPARIPQLT